MGFPEIVPVHTFKSLNDVSTELVAANANRTYLRFQNISDKNFYMNLGGTAVAAAGVRLNTSGPTSIYEMSAARGNLFLGAIEGLFFGGAADIVTILEGSGAAGYPVIVPVHSQVQVAVTSTLIIAANPNRKYLYISDQDSADDVFIKMDAAAVVDEGIRLSAANAERFEWSPRFGNLCTGALYGIHGGAGTALVNVMEGT